MAPRVVEKAHTKTPYIGYNIESLRHPSLDTNRTYLALSNFGGETNHVEILTYNSESNDFEIGYLYDHVFSPVGGVHWMFMEGAKLEDNILGTGSDSIRLFKEGRLLCDLRLKDVEQNNMRIENIYNTYFTKITSFSFSSFEDEDIISTTVDGRCVLWDLNRPDRAKELGEVGSVFDFSGGDNIIQVKERRGGNDSPLNYRYRIVSNLCCDKNNDFVMMDSCFGSSRNNVLLGMNNGLAVSLDLRSPFKQINSVLIDCVHGWNSAAASNGSCNNRGFSPTKLCSIKGTNSFCRAILSVGEIEIFDMRKTCAPLYKLCGFGEKEILNRNNTNKTSSPIVSVENIGVGELLVSHENGMIYKYSIKDGGNSANISGLFDGGRRIYGFSTVNMEDDSKRCPKSFIGISSIYSNEQPGIIVSSYCIDS